MGWGPVGGGRPRPDKFIPGSSQKRSYLFQSVFLVFLHSPKCWTVSPGKHLKKKLYKGAPTAGHTERTWYRMEKHRANQNCFEIARMCEVKVRGRICLEASWDRWDCGWLSASWKPANLREKVPCTMKRSWEPPVLGGSRRGWGRKSDATLPDESSVICLVIGGGHLRLCLLSVQGVGREGQVRASFLN